MKIALAQPFSVGDLAPDAAYPHVYITTLYVNGPARVATVTYEVGELRDVSDGNPMGTWQKAPEVPPGALNLAGEALFPFFLSMPHDLTTPLWDQVEALLYGLVQQADARLAGEVL